MILRISHTADNHIGLSANRYPKATKRPLIHPSLATRLALSELYLMGMDGFFLLDDPFTDMDAARRAAAVQAIRTFAKNHQVLFFTCHPEHAGELQSLAGATTLQMTT